MAVQTINVPVSVGGMDVAPGELVHMDENGVMDENAWRNSPHSIKGGIRQRDGHACRGNNQACSDQKCDYNSRSPQRERRHGLHAEEGLTMRRRPRLMATRGR